MGLLFTIREYFELNCCSYCGRRAVVKCKTHADETRYMCSECLRAIRFREREMFKSILPYGKYEL